MSDPLDPHPTSPMGARLSCRTGRPCRLVAECHTGCCRKVQCLDCGAEVWEMHDLVRPYRFEKEIQIPRE